VGCPLPRSGPIRFWVSLFARDASDGGIGWAQLISRRQLKISGFLPLVALRIPVAPPFTVRPIAAIALWRAPAWHLLGGCGATTATGAGVNSQLKAWNGKATIAAGIVMIGGAVTTTGGNRCGG
jgi:hypothetical protein